MDLWIEVGEFINFLLKFLDEFIFENNVLIVLGLNSMLLWSFLRRLFELFVNLFIFFCVMVNFVNGFLIIKFNNVLILFLYNLFLEN